MITAHFTRAVLVLLSFGSMVVADDFGQALARFEDYDNDEVDDFLVGDPSRGIVFLVSGKTGTLIRKYQIESRVGFGDVIAAASDHDQDGVLDFAVAEQDPKGKPSVFLISGGSGKILRTITSSQAGVYRSPALDCSVDIDGDDCKDLLVGWRGYGRSDDPFLGCVEIYSGRTGNALLSLWGSSAQDCLGWSVAYGGDLDKDGVEDIIAGSLGLYVRVYSGKSGGLLFELREEPLRPYGNLVVRLKDLNEDTYPEFAIRSGERVGGTHEPQVLIYSGRTRKPLFTLAGREDSGFGAAVATTDDLDKDGVDDIAVGADDGFFTAGRVQVYSGKSGQQILVIRGKKMDGFNWHFGSSIMSTTDLDDDGLEDLIIANERHNTGRLKGSVHAVSSGTGKHLYMVDAGSLLKD